MKNAYCNYILLVATMLVSLAIAETKTTIDFGTDKIGDPSGWLHPSPVGKFKVIEGTDGKCLQGEIRTKGKDTCLFYPLPMELMPGKVILTARTKWLQGQGKIHFRLRESQTTKLFAPAHAPSGITEDLVRMELWRDLAWQPGLCWTNYRNGYQPIPKPVSIDDLDNWTTSECEAEIDKRISHPVIQIHVQKPNVENEETIIFQVSQIGVTVIPACPVDLRLSQTWWTQDDSVLLTVSLSPERTLEPDTELMCQAVLMDKNKKTVWSEIVHVSQNNPVTRIPVPSPAASETLTEYQLSVRELSSEKEVIRVLKKWTLWQPPISITKSINRLSTTEPKCSSPSNTTSFEYWADDIPVDRSQLIPPKDWTEQGSERISLSSEHFNIDEQKFGFRIYERLLNETIGLYDLPQQNGYPSHPTSAFAGKRASKLIGLYAIRNIKSVRLELDEEEMPKWLKKHIQLRQLLFYPRKEGENSYRYHPGPLIKPDNVPVEKGTNAYYAVILDLPKEVTNGVLQVPLIITVDDVTKKQSLEFQIFNLKLPALSWHCSFFAGLYGSDTFRSNAYLDMKAMGLDTAILYNTSPLSFVYNKGKIECDFSGYEKELAMMKAAGLNENCPMIVDMRFIQADVTRLSALLNEKSELLSQRIEQPRGPEKTLPNNSNLEAQIYLDILRQIEDRRKSSELWPKTVWFLPQDEIEWGRIEQTERFGKLMKNLDLTTIAVSDGIRWGFDGPQRVDDVIDQRMYGHVYPDVIAKTRASKDGLNYYGLYGDFIYSWAYCPLKTNPTMMSKWAYLWPVGGGFYQITKQPWNSGSTFVAWPTNEKPLPSIITLEVSQAVIDAAMLNLCRETIEHTSSTPKTQALEKCFRKIIDAIPVSTQDLVDVQVSGQLPKGNTEAWRTLITAHLDAILKDDPEK